MSVKPKNRGQHDAGRPRVSRSFMHPAPISRNIHRHRHRQPKQSVYYWWYEYLKRNELYRRCCKSGGKGRLARLYEDFGDVHTGSFEDWWETDERGQRLFAEPPAPVRLEELRTVEEWDADWTGEGVMVVVVPMSEPKRRIKRWFNRLLAQRHTGRPGHPTKKESGALYRIERKFSVPALEQMLLVYDFKQSNSDLTLAEIGQQLRLVTKAMPKPGDSIERLARKRNTMAAAVSRYLKKATAMISNTARGKFPCVD